MASGAPGHGEASPGDHLQTGYRLWLAGHQLEHGQQPWVDPYSFRPEADQANPAWWPYGLPYWPLGARARSGARLERVHPALPVRRRPAGVSLAARARVRSARGCSRRARVRDRAVPDRAEPRPPAWADLADAAARALGVRARPAQQPPGLVVGIPARDRLDPAVGTGSPRARGDPLLLRLRALPRPQAAGRDRGDGGHRRGDPRGAADQADGDQRVDRLGRALAPGGQRLLGDRARHAHAARARKTRRRSSSSGGSRRSWRSPGSCCSCDGGRTRSQASSASARSCRSSSRSGRTTRSTHRSGTSCRRCATRACPSG